MERYLTGLLTDLPRKNCDTIAAAVAGTSTERLQHLLTDATWDPRPWTSSACGPWWRRARPRAFWSWTTPGCPSKGVARSGVARQYSGTLGKVANCQVVVSAHYVADEPTSRAPVHWPLTAQLYLPEAWATDPRPSGQGACPHGGRLSDEARAGACPGGSGAGVGRPVCLGRGRRWLRRQPDFPARPRDRQIAYVVGVSSTFGVRLPDEVRTAALVLPSRPRGRGQPKKPRPAPLYEAKAVLAALPADRWQAITWREHDDVRPPQTVRGRAGALGHRRRPILHQPSPRQHGTGGLAARRAPGARRQR